MPLLTSCYLDARSQSVGGQRLHSVAVYSACFCAGIGMCVPSRNGTRVVTVASRINLASINRKNHFQHIATSTEKQRMFESRSFIEGRCVVPDILSICLKSYDSHNIKREILIGVEAFLSGGEC